MLSANRAAFLLAGMLAALPVLSEEPLAGARLLVQSTPLAGFRYHAAAEDLAASQRAGEGGLDDPAPRRFVHPERWRLISAPHSADEYVDMSEVFQTRGMQALNRRQFGQFHGDAEGAPPARLDRGGGGIDSRLLPSRRDDIRARVRKP